MVGLILKEIGTRLGNVGKAWDKNGRWSQVTEQATSSQQSSPLKQTGFNISDAGNGNFKAGTQSLNTSNMLGDSKAAGLNVGSMISAIKSDERLKQEAADNPVLDAFRKLDAIIFEYNDLAHSLQDNTGSIDNDTHIGIKAQDLEKSDLSSCVTTGPDGYKEVDTKELTMANAAAIAELVKRLDKIEEKLC